MLCPPVATRMELLLVLGGILVQYNLPYLYENDPFSSTVW
jgi:hypothetical protein